MPFFTRPGYYHVSFVLTRKDEGALFQSLDFEMDRAAAANAFIENLNKLIIETMKQLYGLDITTAHFTIIAINRLAE